MIGEDGSQVGILPSRQALTMAREAGLDLVLVTATADPPVCRIIDFGKFKYLQEKLQKDSKKKQQDVKAVKIRPGTAENDLNTVVRNARRFLQDGDKVRVVCQFRAREVTHPEIGRRKLEAIAEELSELGTVERVPTLDGKLMVMVLLPKAPAGGRKHAKEQNQDQPNSGEALQDHGDRQDHPAEGEQQPHVPEQEPGAASPTGAGADAV